MDSFAYVGVLISKMLVVLREWNYSVSSLEIFSLHFSLVGLFSVPISFVASLLGWCLVTKN